jgi:hypothetical protein
LQKECNLFKISGVRMPKLDMLLNALRTIQPTSSDSERGSFSEESDKIGQGFIKILETWQFGLSFNIIRHVFFCFGQKKIYVGFML